MLKIIGEGSFGEVWLAQTLTGNYRALKIVKRSNFENGRPYDREFEGLRRFEPISQNHPNWVSIFHTGMKRNGEHFYYVMEAADDLETGEKINEESYIPKTLSSLFAEKGVLPLEECIRLGITLADALAALHQLEMIHRDVKPSNIIFVKGQPKLADIGLVAYARQGVSAVGTPDYMPTEGVGKPSADIFALGRVLYHVSTGCEPQRHPELPTSLGARPDGREFMMFMEIVNKACAEKLEDRYETAGQLKADLEKLVEKS